jgi:hypothetical protein
MGSGSDKKLRERKNVSRKGAKAQRRRRKERAAFNLLACFLCAFAPLRETFAFKF